MTKYHSPSRNQRPRGLKVKEALQFSLLLAICLWLLYQIKPSHDEKKNQDKSVQTKLSEESNTVILGRKGNAAWSNDRKNSEPEDANFMGKMVTNDGGDTRNEKKDAEGENYQEKKDIAALDETEMHDSNLLIDKYEAEQNREDELAAVNQKGVVNVTIREHSFNDENGIPQHLQGSYQKINLHHSTVSASKNASKLAERKTVAGVVESEQGLTANVQDSENDSIKDVSCDTESSEEVNESKV